MAWLVAPGNHVAALDTKDPSTVGTHPACTLVVREELGVALQHYRIVPFGEKSAELHSLAPLGMEVKLNGVAINSEPCPLRDGDTISTGNLKLIFRLTDPALGEMRPAPLLEDRFSRESPTGIMSPTAAPPAAQGSPSGENHAPVLPELPLPAVVVPLADTPPVIPVGPAAPGATALPPEPDLPRPEPAGRPTGLVLPQKMAPERATPGRSNHRKNGKKFLGGGFRAIITGAVALWLCAGAYAFIDPLRNVVNDLIGYNPIPPATMEKIERTVEAKNPSPGDLERSNSPVGVAGPE